MQRFATPNYSILHYTVTYYTTRYITLHYDALNYTKPYHTTVHIKLHNTTPTHNTLHWTTQPILCYTVLHYDRPVTCLCRHRGRRTCSSNPFATRRCKEVCGQHCAPAPLHPTPKRSNTHCTGGWVGPCPVWTVRKISAPPGFDHQTVHHVTSPYSHYAILAAITLEYTVVSYITLYYTLLYSIKV
jgi:hypothetical protein